MPSSYDTKHAARRLAEVSGHPYQKCLNALRAGHLDSLVPCPSAATPATVVDVCAAGLASSGSFDTPRDARVALLEATVAEVVRHHFADAVEAVVTMDDAEPPVGWLAGVTFADGTELEGTIGEPVADAAFVWADLLARELELAPDDGHAISLA